METLLSLVIPRINYWAYILLLMIGLYGIIIKKNFIKKIIGLNIFQTAIILFFISISAKQKATIPIITHMEGSAHAAVKATDYINPLPHVLMLTAIVVAVATLGVALALAIEVYRRYNTLEEDQIIEQIKSNP